MRPCRGGVEGRAAGSQRLPAGHRFLGPGRAATRWQPDVFTLDHLLCIRSFPSLRLAVLALRQMRVRSPAAVAATPAAWRRPCSDYRSQSIGWMGPLREGRAVVRRAGDASHGGLYAGPVGGKRDFRYHISGRRLLPRRGRGRGGRVKLCAEAPVTAPSPTQIDADLGAAQV